MNYEEERHLEIYRQQCAVELERYKQEYETTRKMTDMVMQVGMQAMKSLFIAHGGAVIALLTFIGNDKTNGSSYDAPLMARALATFGVGAAAALMVTVFAYVAQALIAEVPPGKDFKEPFEAAVFRYAAVGFGATSAILFAWAVFIAINAFYLGAK